MQRTSYKDDIFLDKKLLAGQGLSNISLKTVSVFHGNFLRNFLSFTNNLTLYRFLGGPDFLAVLGLNSC